MKNSLVLIISLFAVLSLQSCSRDKGKPVERTVSLEAGIASDFTLTDTTGRKISLSSYKGQVVLLEFWATWCPPCRATIPELIALQEKYKTKGLVVLAVAVDEGQDLAGKLSAFSRENNINYTVLLGNESAAKAYNISSIPASFLIGKDGKILKVVIGAVENLESMMSPLIDKAL